MGRIAEAYGATCAQISLAWLRSKPVVTAPIVGATKVEHLDDAVAALDLDLTADETDLRRIRVKAVLANGDHTTYGFPFPCDPTLPLGPGDLCSPVFDAVEIVRVEED